MTASLPPELQQQIVAAILHDVSVQWEREQVLTRRVRKLSEVVKPA